MIQTSLLRPLRRVAGPSFVFLAALSLAPAFAEEKGEPAAPPPPGPSKVRVIGADGKELTPQDAPLTDVQRYCANIADPALDARTALQMAELQKAEADVSAKIDELETKRQEVQAWLADRKDFIDSTSDVMIGIYSGMKPDAAASQIAGLDRPVAASLLTRLKARQASAILAEMPAPVASELAALIVAKTDRASAETLDKGKSL